MAQPTSPERQHTPKVAEGIARITVCGYKSISQEQQVDIRPLTLLAGANSSGKSSIMQPLLLIKQTLEASYDPGALLLNGPNIRFTSTNQLLSKSCKGKPTGHLQVGIRTAIGDGVELCFARPENKSIEIKYMGFTKNGHHVLLNSGMTQEEIISSLPPEMTIIRGHFGKPGQSREAQWVVSCDRCFLMLGIRQPDRSQGTVFLSGYPPFDIREKIGRQIRQLIHLPGLRGNPERTYPVTAVGPSFQGTFEKYVASVISTWQEAGDPKLDALALDLVALGLTWKVDARRIDDTQVELRVGRLLHPVSGGAKDLVSIADVGFGVSQTLPVLVALLAARPGQFLYIEQPEIHLHPRAQVAMAKVLAAAARRGVRVVAETHSSLLLQGVQALIARDEMPPDLVKLHWFKRLEDGSTQITSADLDKSGAFGDWPEDFGEVELKAQSDYLDAAEARQKGK